MIDLLKFLIVFIGVSAVLYLTYIVYLRYRCGYNLARVYLLSIPVVALLSASVTFNVIPSPEDSRSGGVNIQAQTIGTLIDDFAESIESVSAEEVAYLESSSGRVITENGSIESSLNEVLTGESVDVVSSPLVESINVGGMFDIIVILSALYLLGLMTRLIVLAIQVRKILSIKRWATIENFNDITLYRSGLIDTPFSFIRNIFIDRRADGDKLQMIVQHELSHIDNRHYLDKNIVEVMCIFMWFNPIVWYIRNELGAIHEFQADNNLIKDGVDIKTYQHYLFEEIMGKSPSIANGFNHSLIKKRMIMMMRSQMFKNSLAKTSFAVMSVIMIFVSVSFKHAESEVAIAVESVVEYQPIVAVDYYNDVADGEDIVVEAVIADDIVIDEVAIENILIDDIVVTEVIATEAVAAADKISVEDIAQAIGMASRSSDMDDKKIKKGKYFNGEYILSQDQIRGIPDYITLNRTPSDKMTGVVGIDANEKETLVDFVVKCGMHRGWVVFSERTFLRDQSTNDRYKVRGIKGGIPLGQVLIVTGRQGQYICFTLVFPPLEKGVKMVDFMELDSETRSRNPGGGYLSVDNDLNVSELQIRKTKSVVIIE